MRTSICLFEGGIRLKMQIHIGNSRAIIKKIKKWGIVNMSTKGIKWNQLKSEKANKKEVKMNKTDTKNRNY